MCYLAILNFGSIPPAVLLDETVGRESFRAKVGKFALALRPTNEGALSLRSGVPTGQIQAP